MAVNSNTEFPFRLPYVLERGTAFALNHVDQVCAPSLHVLSHDSVTSLSPGAGEIAGHHDMWTSQADLMVTS